MALCPRKLDPGISFCRGLMFWSQCRKVLKHDNTHTSGCLTYHVDIYIYTIVWFVETVHHFCKRGMVVMSLCSDPSFDDVCWNEPNKVISGTAFCSSVFGCGECRTDHFVTKSNLRTHNSVETPRGMHFIHMFSYKHVCPQDHLQNSNGDIRDVFKDHGPLRAIGAGMVRPFFRWDALFDVDSHLCEFGVSRVMCEFGASGIMCL